MVRRKLIFLSEPSFLLWLSWWLRVIIFGCGGNRTHI